MISSRIPSSLFLFGLSLLFLFVGNEAFSGVPRSKFADITEITNKYGFSDNSDCRMCQVAAYLSRNKGCPNIARRSVSACYAPTLAHAICTDDTSSCIPVCGHSIFTIASTYCSLFKRTPFFPVLNTWSICQSSGPCKNADSSSKYTVDQLFEIARTPISEAKLREFLQDFQQLVPPITSANIPSSLIQEETETESSPSSNFLNGNGNILNGGGNILNGGGNILNGGGNILNTVVSSNDYLVQSATICERTSQTISCPSGQSITILSARYGRSSGGGICPGANDFNNNCPGRPTNDLSSVAALCNGKNSCPLTPSNDIFTDPCYGTYKYLGLNYICSGQGVIICEGSSASLSCSSGKVIQITSAHFGRTTDGSTCPGANSDVTTCEGNPTSDMTAVTGLCNKKTSCVLTPTDTLFGDPCYGTYKYLAATYQCVFSSNFFLEKSEESANSIFHNH